MASDVRHSQKKIPIIVIIIVSPSLAFIQFEPICLLLHISLFLPSTSPDSWIWVSGDQITSNCNNIIISQLLSWPPLVPFADPMTEGRLKTPDGHLNFDIRQTVFSFASRNLLFKCSLFQLFASEVEPPNLNDGELHKRGAHCPPSSPFAELK